MDNWVYGGVASDDAFKGSNTTDQPNIPPLANHSVTSANEFLQEKWAFCYDAIQRANDAIREIPLVKDGSVTPAYATEVIAEARFLRAVFHFELGKMYRNVPYVGEQAIYSAGNLNIANSGPIWDSIEVDLTAAMAMLQNPGYQIVAQATTPLEAFLAKTYMFDHNKQALPLLTSILLLTERVRAAENLSLDHLRIILMPPKRITQESVFCVQMDS